MRVKLCSAPSRFGTNIRGCENAPDKLLSMGLCEIILKHGHILESYGRVFYDDVKSLKKSETNKWLKCGEDYTKSRILNFSDLICFNRILASKALEITAGNDFAIFLGGDHSISIGTIRGVLKNHPNTAVIWMDAHDDTSTPNNSTSRNAHGMAAMALMSAGSIEDKFYNALCNPLESDKIDPLKGENIFFLGLRWFELVINGKQQRAAYYGNNVALPNIEDRTLYLRTADEIRRLGFEQVVSEINEKLDKRGIDRIHLSLDIDILDKAFVLKTGTPVSDGLDVYTLKLFLSAFARSGKLRSMDIVELNPEINKELDKDDKTERVVLELLEVIFMNLT